MVSALRLQGTFDREELDVDAVDTIFICGNCRQIKKINSVFLDDELDKDDDFTFKCSICGLRKEIYDPPFFRNGDMPNWSGFLSKLGYS